MAKIGSEKKFLIGLLVGAGVGLAVAVVLKPRPAARPGRAPDLDRGPQVWRNHRTKRAGKTLEKRIERMRSAGY